MVAEAELEVENVAAGRAGGWVADSTMARGEPVTAGRLVEEGTEAGEAEEVDTGGELAKVAEGAMVAAAAKAVAPAAPVGRSVPVAVVGGSRVAVAGHNRF
jgi:hypothetical protein